MKEFTYSQKSFSCFYNGQWFDSLLELRFILSIEETHCWLRENLSIYYAIDEVPEGIQGGLSSYTPDILIRNKNTGLASLVEIKPSNFNDKWELRKRQKIAMDFIRLMGYDWEFKVVFASQIHLSKEAEMKFQTLIKGYKNGAAHFPAFFYSTQIEADKKFVMNGVLSSVDP